jgi:hypothetical protein
MSAYLDCDESPGVNARGAGVSMSAPSSSVFTVTPTVSLCSSVSRAAESETVDDAPANKCPWTSTSGDVATTEPSVRDSVSNNVSPWSSTSEDTAGNIAAVDGTTSWLDNGAGNDD